MEGDSSGAQLISSMKMTITLAIGLSVNELVRGPVILNISAEGRGMEYTFVRTVSPSLRLQAPVIFIRRTFIKPHSRPSSLHLEYTDG